MDQILSVHKLLMFAFLLVSPLGAITEVRAQEGPKTLAKWEYNEIQLDTLNARVKLTCTYRRSTIEVQTWEELARRLVVPLDPMIFAVDGSTPGAVYRLAIFDHLGSQGWELVSHARTQSSETYFFKRPVPKGK